MVKRIFYVSLCAVAVALFLTATPWGVEAQQTIRNMTVTEDPASDLAVDTDAIRTAAESTATSLDNIETNLSQDAVHDNAARSAGPQGVLEAKDFDGSALPNNVSAEGDAVRSAGSLYGINYSMLVSEDGSLQYGTSTTPFVVGGNVAHDAADAGNPLKFGGIASTSLAGRTMVANNDRTDAVFGIDGALLMRPYVLEDLLQERDTNTDGTSTAFGSDLAAPGAGLRLYITSCTFTNTHASTTAIVDLRDGAAGSVIDSVPVPPNKLGAIVTYPTPLKLTANTALAYDVDGAVSTISIACRGFKSKI